jgi:peptide deformylase
MAVLTIDMVPQHQHLLRRVSQPARNDRATYDLVTNMFDTLYSLNIGRGLSAIQVGVPERVFVMDAGRRAKNMGYEARALINPVILYRSKRHILTEEEGCLSIPKTCEKGGQLPVPRSGWVVIRYTVPLIAMGRVFIGGETVEKHFSGLEARIIQHEMDHLDGKLITDYLPTASSRPDVPIRLLAAE